MDIQLNRSCSHLKVTGESCGAYALRDSELCYWHHKARACREERSAMNQRMNANTTGIVLPLMEDANAVQVAIQMIAQAVADRRITRNEAGMLLYSVQLAIMNLKHMDLPEAVYSVEMRVKPTDGDEYEDLAPEVEIPMDKDPKFKKVEVVDDEDEDDEDDEDDDEDEEEDDPEENATVERFMLENAERIKKLLPAAIG